jgi:hypothetical protein
MTTPAPAESTTFSMLADGSQGVQALFTVRAPGKARSER